jgi:dihydroorotate dehydrogenase electron transfer subunit
MPELINAHNVQAIYACGPMPMLKAVAKVADAHNAFSQCAVEESMACGIGVCMTCVLPVVGDDGITRMVRSCVEGPVFRGDRVRWDDVDTVPSDVLGAPVPGGH